MAYRRKRLGLHQRSKLGAVVHVSPSKELTSERLRYRQTKGREWVHRVCDGLHIDLLAFAAEADNINRQACRQLEERVLERSQALAERRFAISVLAQERIRTSFLRLKPDNTPICYLCSLSTTTGACSCTLKTVVQHVQESYNSGINAFSLFLSKELTDPRLLSLEELNKFQETQLKAMKQLDEDNSLRFGKDKESICHLLFQLIFRALKYKLIEHLSNQSSNKKHCNLCGSVRWKYRNESQKQDELVIYCMCEEEDVAEAIDEWISTSESASIIRAIRDDKN